MKTGKITRFLALCLALISLSMMVAGILGMRSAVKDRKKDDAEIQDIQNKIDDYRELSATLTDTENYKSLSDTLEEKQKQYNSDMSRHKTELATYTATNGGLQMGLEALAQAKAALQAGKIQIEMYEQLIDRYRPVLLALEPLMQDIANLRELLIGLENDLAGNANGSLLGSIQDAETGIDGFQSALNAVIDDQWVQVEEGLRQYLTEQGVPAEEIEAIISAVPGIWNNGGNWDELLSVLNELADQYREQNLDEEDDGGEDSGGDDPVEDVDIPNDGNGNPDGNGEDPNDGENASGDSDDDPAENDGNIDDDNTDDSVKGNIDDDQNADAPASLDSNDTGFSLNTLTEDGGLVSENSGPLAQASSESGTEADQQTNIEHLPDEERITSPKTGDDGIHPKINSVLLGNLEKAAEALLKAFNKMEAGVNNISDDIVNIQYAVSLLEADLNNLQSAMNHAGIDADLSLNSLLNIDFDSILQQTAGGLTEETGNLIPALSDIISGLSADDLALVYSDYLQFKEDLKKVIQGDEEYIIENAMSMQARASGYKVILQTAEDAVTLLSDQIYELLLSLDSMEGNNSLDIGSLSDMLGSLDLDEYAEMIEAGEEALAEGEAELLAAKEDQKKKAEELDREKRDLDAREKALSQMSEQTESQKSVEDREQNVRLSLLSREEIRRRTDYGEDLLTASEGWLDTLKDEAEDNYKDRFDASLLMIFCAVLAMAGALLNFGKGTSVVMALIVTLLCQAFAFSAVFLLFRMGRGLSWSALVTMLLATAELVTLIPAFTPDGNSIGASTGKTAGKTARK